MNSDRMTTIYEPPRLRPLGSVHAMTQAGLLGKSSDGILFTKELGVVIGS